jgi:outer membrane protein
MKRLFTLFLWAAAAWAADPLQLSLKRAIEIATSPEGSARIQLAGEAVKVAESRQAQARAALLPNLDGSFTGQNLTRNLEALGVRFQSPIAGLQFPTFVGPFTTVDARVTGSQTVFDFSSIRRLQAARTGVTAAKSDVEGSAEAVAAQVARAYLGAVKADADVAAAQANLTLAEAVLKQAEDQKQVGTGTGIEITRARVQLANDRQRLVAVQNARRGAGLQLLRAMGMRLDTEIELTDKLQAVPVDAVTLEEARAQAVKTRPDLRAQQERESNARLSSSATRLERLPSIATFADYGSIGTSLTNALPTRTVGVSVRVPLFDGGRREARRAESLSAYRSEQVKTHDLKEQIELDVRLALDNLTSAAEQVKVSNEGLDLAQNELAQAQRRYDAGVAAGLEVTDAQTRLERARDNQTTALYSYNLARLDLAQAIGKVRSMVP